MVNSLCLNVSFTSKSLKLLNSTALISFSSITSSWLLDYFVVHFEKVYNNLKSDVLSEFKMSVVFNKCWWEYKEKGTHMVIEMWIFTAPMEIGMVVIPKIKNESTVCYIFLRIYPKQIKTEFFWNICIPML